MSEVRTFRGRSLEVVLPEIRAQLGPEAVVVARREVLEGGVGGFFARRRIEIDARGPAVPALDVRADAPALPDAAPPVTSTDFQAHLERSTASAAIPLPPAEDPWAQEEAEPVVAPAPEPGPEPEVVAPTRPPARPRDPVLPNAPLLAGDGSEADLDLLVDVAVPDPDPRPDDLTAELEARGLGAALARAVRDGAVRRAGPGAGAAALHDALAPALAAHIPVAPPRPGADGLAVAFTGPNGSGKTRAAAALATAYATRSALRVAVVALRPGDEGDELRRLLAGLEVELHVEDSAAGAARRVASLRGDRGLVVVDTPGASPRAAGAQQRLADELALLALDATYACVPATIGATAGRELLAGLAPSRPTGVALTHADETAQPGGALDVVLEAGLPVALVGRSDEVRAGLRPAVAAELAAAVLA